METSLTISTEDKVKILLNQDSKFILQSKWSIIKRQLFGIGYEMIRDQKREFLRRIFERLCLKYIL